MQQLDALIDRAAVLHLDVVDPHQLRVLGTLAVQRLQDLGDLRLVLRMHQQALQSFDRGHVGRVALDHLTVDLDRRLGRVHALFAQ